MKRSFLLLFTMLFASCCVFLASPSWAKSRHRHKNSEHVKAGDRVVVAESDQPKPTAVDPQTWKLVTLRSETDGGKHESINVHTVVSPEWLKSNKAGVGTVVALPLDLEEAGLKDGLRAKITGINPCPEIKDGSGRIVLSTVDFMASDVYEMTCQHGDGHRETVRRAGSHRYFSNDRDDWIELKDAKPNETIRGLGHEPLKILSVEPTGRTERIYDLTVEGNVPYHTGWHHELTNPPHHQAEASQATQSTKHHAEIPRQVWTYGAAGNRLQNAEDHWHKHGMQFPNLKSEQEYVQFAYDFVQSAPMKKKRQNGDTMFFDPKSGVFAITDRHGVMRTCFKPSHGLDYYNRQD